MNIVTRRELTSVAKEAGLTISVEKATPQIGFTINRVYADEYQIGAYSNLNKKPDYTHMMSQLVQLIDYLDDMDDLEAEVEEALEAPLTSPRMIEIPDSLYCPLLGGSSDTQVVEVE